jgi:hypothetical protein
MRIRDPGWRQFGSGIRDGDSADPGSGMEKSRIRDPVSGIRKAVNKNMEKHDETRSTDVKEKINILPLPSLNKANYCCYIVRKGYAVPGYFYVMLFIVLPIQTDSLKNSSKREHMKS